MKCEASDLSHLYTFLLLAYHQVDCQCIFSISIRKTKTENILKSLALSSKFYFVFFKCGRLATLLVCTLSVARLEPADFSEREIWGQKVRNDSELNSAPM